MFNIYKYNEHNYRKIVARKTMFSTIKIIAAILVAFI
jgi:hypothetical protein